MNAKDINRDSSSCAFPSCYPKTQQSNHASCSGLMPASSRDNFWALLHFMIRMASASFVSTGLMRRNCALPGKLRKRERASVAHPFKLPNVNPFCQYRCRSKKPAINGMMDRSEPVITRVNRICEPLKPWARPFQIDRPTVNG